MTHEELDEFTALANPLIKWLNDHHNPHTKILIDNESAEILGGEGCHRTREFWRD